MINRVLFNRFLVFVLGMSVCVSIVASNSGSSLPSAFLLATGCFAAPVLKNRCSGLAWPTLGSFSKYVGPFSCFFRQVKVAPESIKREDKSFLAEDASSLVSGSPVLPVVDQTNEQDPEPHVHAAVRTLIPCETDPKILLPLNPQNGALVPYRPNSFQAEAEKRVLSIRLFRGMPFDLVDGLRVKDHKEDENKGRIESEVANREMETLTPRKDRRSHGGAYGSGPRIKPKPRVLPSTTSNQPQHLSLVVYTGASSNNMSPEEYAQFIAAMVYSEMRQPCYRSY